MGKCKHKIFIERIPKTKENLFVIIRFILGIYLKTPHGIINIIYIPLKINL